MATTMKLIGKNTLGSDTASVTFSDVPGTYTDLMAVISARTDRNFQVGGVDINGDQILISFNSSTANFSSRYLESSGSGSPYSSTLARYAGLANASTNTASSFGSSEIYIPNYAGSTNKSYSATGASEHNGTVAYLATIAGLWSSTASITSVGFAPSGGTVFKSGSSFFLYGITKA